VWGIRLAKKDDAVVGVEVVDPAATLLCVAENGYGKRTSFEEYRPQGRGGQGIITMKTTERNGMVVGAHAVREHDAFMIITEMGQMIRMPVDDIRVISRNTQGVRLINLGEGDKVVSATPVEPQADDGGEEAGPGDAAPAAPNE
jgi:DNA gyrase subunit A